MEEYRDNWIKYPQESYVSRVPLCIDIELTNRCNRKCKMCPYHGNGKESIYYQEPREMSFDVYKKVIDEVSEKGTKAIKINFGGEPLLYSKIVKAVRYAKKKGILDVQINTNGDFLTLKMSTQLLEAGLDVLILSDYNDTAQLANGIIFNVKRGKIHSKCKFHVNKVEDNHKWEGLADKIDPVIYYDFYNPPDNRKITSFKCPYPWQRLLVLANGNVKACSCGSITSEQIIGNVNDYAIEELWNSKKMNDLRFAHENGFSHHISYCRRCHLRDGWIEKGSVRT